jgi:hypothetical protein
MPPDTSLLFGAVFRDPASISFREGAPESTGSKILAVSRRSWLLPPGIIQITTVDRIEAKIVDEAKHCCLGVQRIAEYRESDPPLRSPRKAFFEKAFGEDVIEGLDHGAPDLLRDPLAIEHAAFDRIDAAIAKLGMVVANIDDDDAARYVRKHRARKISDGLRWDRDDDDFSGFGSVDNGNGRRADLRRQPGQTVRSSRVRNQDVMATLGKVARKYLSHASGADDSDSHVE